MISQESSPKGHSPTTPPRSNLTPAGFKNVRVFVPQSLHFQLISHSAASEMSLQDFVVAWLERATPLTPAPSSERQTVKEPAPGPRPANDHQGGTGLARGLVIAQGQQEPSPGHRPANRPLVVPGNAVGPCAAPPPGAEAMSAVPLNPDPASSGSSAAFDPAKSTSVKDNDEAEAERTRPR